MARDQARSASGSGPAAADPLPPELSTVTDAPRQTSGR